MFFQRIVSHRLVLATFASCTCIGTLAPISAKGQAIEKLELEWNKKCGPLSGTTPQQMFREHREQYDECASLATKLNQTLGLPGPGFAVKRRATNLSCSVDFNNRGGGQIVSAGSRTCHPSGVIAICTGGPSPNNPSLGAWELTHEACAPEAFAAGPHQVPCESLSRPRHLVPPGVYDCDGLTYSDLLR